MGPPEECDEGPPAPEPFEVRGPMDGYPPRGPRSPSMPSCLVRALQEKGDSVIQVYSQRLGGVRWTAAALLRRAQRLARGLRGRGLAPGDVLSFVGGAHPDYGPLFLATLLNGASFAPLNHRFDDGDLRRLLALMEPKVVVAVAEVAPRLRALLEAGDSPPPLVFALDGDAHWDALGAAEEEAPPEEHVPVAVPVAVRGRGVALIACSSGSTGLPKGVVSSYEAIHAALDMFLHPAADSGVRGTLLVTSPAFWVTGIWYTLLSMLAEGLCVVFEYGANEEQFLEAVEEHRPETIFTANNFLLSVAKAHEASPAPRDLSSVQVALCGGAAMSPEADAFMQRIFSNARLLSAYGMTELNAGIGFVKVGERKMGSVGKVGPFLRCKVVELATGRAAGPGRAGELRFKGPTLCSGYLRNARATAALFDAEGWLRSGDVGFYDEDGFFFVTGRIKDTIKYRGVHVSPVELEGLLEAHPAVLESAVVGVPHPTEQELPRAYVVLRPGAAVAAEDLQRLVQESVAEHKWLRGGVVFLPALPKSATGKISRAEIRRLYVTPIDI